MIVVVEGIDRVGKTTLCEKLERFGFIVFKDVWHTAEQLESSEVASYSLGKLDTSITLLKMLADQDVDVVVDRLHLTELVYGTCEGRGVRAGAIFKIDSLLAKMGCTLVYVKPTDIKRSSQKACKDLSQHDITFSVLIELSAIKDKHVIDYNGIDEIFSKIINKRDIDKALKKERLLAK